MTIGRILLADDDRVVLLTLSEGLRGEGFEVVTARNGEDALALCLNHPPDLALLDIRMPGLNGIDLAKRLRDETDVPFLFLSAYDDEKLVKVAVEIGALGYLVKPLQVRALVPALHTALARARDIYGLVGAVSSNRTIATAVGMMMQADGIDQAEAFARLREEARKQRCKVEDLAQNMIRGEERRKPPDSDNGR